MIYIYLLYGLVFIALGLMMAMTARAPMPVLPRSSLWLLAAFGFLHGAHEWIHMGILILERTVGDGGILLLQSANLVPLSISFALIMQSGIETLITLQQWPRWSRIVPALLLVFWAVLAISVRQGFGVDGTIVADLAW